MIELKDITKVYKTGDFEQSALDGVSLTFRETEFVVILGPSGSGKTTFLNVVGGLDKYTSGDLIVNGTSTKKFKDKQWDAYRNKSVGFVFQSYNLIPHLNVLDNVEMAMTLSGVSAAEKRAKALELLDKAGLTDHINKKPSQLSGGQMQRVAIARALANDPDIILADEPTGALDGHTSQQIMDLIKEISKDKLVVVVSHNAELAERYADRIVKFSDGKVVHDTAPYISAEEPSGYKLKKTSMSFITALKLSGKNIMTKKRRTALTAFAASIGIISVALVLSISNGFDKQIDNFEKDALSNYPVTIDQTAISASQMMGAQNKEKKTEFPNTDKVKVYDSSKDNKSHTNKITSKYVAYINKMNKSYYSGISYTRSVNMNVLKKYNGKASKMNLTAAGFNIYPAKGETDYNSYFSSYYSLMAGSYPKSDRDLILVVDKYNELDKSMIKALGISTSSKNIDFDKFVGKKYKLIYNDDYYSWNGSQFTARGTASELYDSSKAITLRICAVVRIKSGTKVSSLSSGIAYSDSLAKEYIKNARKSDVVKKQKDADYNVLDGSTFADSSTLSQQYNYGGSSGGDDISMGMGTANGTAVSTLTKKEVLASLGAETVPTSISIYPVSFSAKEKVTKYLDNWNDGLKKKDQIIYTDMAELITSLSKTIMNGITIVLVAFAAISLVVSMIMIGIIIYISVLERRKEIGILRALGARKKDITRVFNAETFIIGACSGILGVLIGYLLTIPANSILYNMTELKNVAVLNPLHAAALVAISIVLTMIGGFIPAKMAAKKDPVEALRE